MEYVSANVLIKSAGIACVGWLIFHLLFWPIFDWRAQLQRVSSVNRGVMQVLNLCLSFVFLLFAVVSIFYTDQLLTGGLGRVMLLGMAIFWLLRLLEQPIFFGWSRTSNLFSLLFLLMSASYFLPWALYESQFRIYQVTPK